MCGIVSIVSASGTAEAVRATSVNSLDLSTYLGMGASNFSPQFGQATYPVVKGASQFSHSYCIAISWMMTQCHEQVAWVHYIISPTRLQATCHKSPLCPLAQLSTLRADLTARQQTFVAGCPKFLNGIAAKAVLLHRHEQSATNDGCRP